MMTRKRLRDLGIVIGRFPAGTHNAITDVPDILVGHKTIICDQPRIARTGVTVILPRNNGIWQDYACAGYFSLNGCGEMTGMHWLAESGFLETPIALTNTNQVGTVHEALVRYGQEKGLTPLASLPVVAETWDGWLNDANAFLMRPEDVYAAIESASSGRIAEGNVGGGTGMICHDFKGGIGTASRVVEMASGRYTIGALVQANHGSREDLRVNGVAVGQKIGWTDPPTPYSKPYHPVSSSSLIVVLATDAPLLPTQCQRLARRATIGFARAGGVGHNGSGDIFLAFSTGNHVPAGTKTPLTFQALPNSSLNELFVATAEAVEEAILNVLTAAETMTGYQGRTVHALPLDQLQEIMNGSR